AKAREVGFYFSDLEQFRTFVTDPMETLKQLGIDPSLVPSLLGLSTTEPIEGVDLDATKLQQVVKVGKRRTYRVEATASFDKLEKRIVGVWDTSVVRQNTRSMGAGSTPGGGARGAWVFWREE
ncbi:MAG TPA: hypothetical protein VNM90_26880, partial [Haliangium sp.]|nr:hypothetical protein [Haliangium sp.]